jgi:hypothetical protein
MVDQAKDGGREIGEREIVGYVVTSGTRVFRGLGGVVTIYPDRGRAADVADGYTACESMAALRPFATQPVTLKLHGG